MKTNKQTRKQDPEPDSPRIFLMTLYDLGGYFTSLSPGPWNGGDAALHGATVKSRCEEVWGHCPRCPRGRCTPCVFFRDRFCTGAFFFSMFGNLGWSARLL